MSDLDEEQEALHYDQVLLCLRSYASTEKRRIQCLLDNMEKLSSEYCSLMSSYRERLKSLLPLFDVNQKFLDEISLLHERNFKSSRPSPVIQDNTRSLIRQLVRDWSSEGTSERAACYGTLISAIDDCFAHAELKSKVRLLVPGAGLGRLVYEITSRGFSCQGNEFSLLMLFASELIINHGTANRWMIYPYLTPLSNIAHAADQDRAVCIPDIRVQRTEGEFSMVAGEFLEVYTRPGELEQWDAVVCSFFLDTSHNVLDYLQTIRGLLKPGGYLINLGPLLYHFEGALEGLSIELTMDELIELVEKVGFNLVKRQYPLACTYVQNPHSMLHSSYNCLFFVAQKPLIIENVNK
jgi:carnosine N-methyltransferase